MPCSGDSQLRRAGESGRGIGPVELDDHVEVVDRGFHRQRGEKVVEAQHMALDSDRGILVCLPSEPAKVGTGLGLAAGQVAQAGFGYQSRSSAAPNEHQSYARLRLLSLRTLERRGDCVGMTGDRFGSSWSLTHAPSQKEQRYVGR